MMVWPREAADQQAAPPGGPPSLAPTEEQSPQPEDDEDRARAGQGRGQTESQHRASQQGGGQSNRIDAHPLAPAGRFRKENSVLSLQYLKGIHAIRPFIALDPLRELGYALKTQQRDE